MEETARAAMLRLRPLARLTRAHVLGDIKVLTNPEGKATNQRPRLGPPEVPAEWAVVALAEHLRPEPTACGNAEAVRLALPAAVQETATHQKGTTFGRVSSGHDGRTVPVNRLAEGCRRAQHDGSEERIVAQCCRQGLDEGGREEEVGRGGRWWWSSRRPGPQRKLRAGQRNEHTSTRGE